MTRAQPGDIILFRLDTSKWQAWLRPWAAFIAWLQSNPVTHTAIIVDGKWNILVEAYWPRVRRVFFDDVIWDKCYDWDLVRPVGSITEQRAKAAEFALELVGRRYDLTSLFSLTKWLLLEKVFGVFVRGKVTIDDKENRLFCSELVTQCYEKAGFPLAARMGFTDTSAVVPRDMDLNRKVFEVIESSQNWPTNG